MLYIFDKKKLSYRKIPIIPLIVLVIVSIVMTIVSFFASYEVTTMKKEKSEYEESMVYITRYDDVPNSLQTDSIFTEYEKRANVYLSRPIFNGSPVKAKYLALAGRKVYDSLGILVPLELALAQAQYESSMGRTGRSPVRNPYNIGEYDNGTANFVDKLQNTYDGVELYYFYVAKNYLRCKSLDELFTNYTTCSGHRYASAPNYEEHISSQYYYIKRWINRNM